jgi:hypothetical protein
MGADLDMHNRMINVSYMVFVSSMRRQENLLVLALKKIRWLILPTNKVPFGIAPAPYSP